MSRKNGKAPTHLGDLRPDPQNARRHNPRNIGQIERSLQQYGAARSIVIDEDNQIIAGHGVVEAAAQAGIERVQVVDADGETVIAVRRSGLTKKQKADLAIADNRASDLSEWDADVLASLKDEIDLSQFFHDNELAELLGPLEPPEDPGPQLDRAEELRVKWGVESGQLWALGEHRLICGDCTDPAVVAQVMGGEKADGVWTDPPYGIEYSGGRTQTINRDPSRKVDWDSDNLSMFTKTILDIGANDTWMCVSPVNLSPVFIASEGARNVSAIIVWNKGQPGLGWQWVRRQCEFVLFYTKREKKKTDDSEFDYWDIPTDPKTDYLHSTQKPVALVERSLRFSPGDVWLDPFCGSGTTVVACERLGRQCRAIEISPAYCAVNLERWSQMSGKTPRLAHA